MTVKELRKKVEGLDPNTQVGVYRETEGKTEFYDVTDVALQNGNPIRNEESRKAGFTFDNKGPATWLFISIEES